MYGIKKLQNYFELNSFSEVNFRHACATLGFEKVKKKDCKTFWGLFLVLKKTNELVVNHLECEGVEKAEFLVQQLCTGSYALGLEYIATYAKNMELAISEKDHCTAMEIFDKYQKHNVFDNAEKVILRYKSRLFKLC